MSDRGAVPPGCRVASIRCLNWNAFLRQPAPTCRRSPSQGCWDSGGVDPRGGDLTGSRNELWGRRAYGEPCRECGFSWSIDPTDAEALVASLPARLTELLADASGSERHPALAWSLSSYVSHIGDNLRVWAERLAGNSLGGPTWSPAIGSIVVLGTLIRDWAMAVAMAPADLRMVHPDREETGMQNVVRSSAHDAIHHEWDIRRSRQQRHCPRARLAAGGWRFPVGGVRGCAAGACAPAICCTGQHPPGRVRLRRMA